MNVPRPTPDYDDGPAADFVQELTGVPKVEQDFSHTSSEESGDEEGKEGKEQERQDPEYDSEAEESRREALQQQKRLARKKLKQKRHADERSANARLLQVQRVFNEEMTLFGQNQYRQGIKKRMDKATRIKYRHHLIPDYRDTAQPKESSAAVTGEEFEDELTTIQERALTFAAEDRTRKILDRLPYVIRQGALGDMPHYVKNGLPKPVATEAEFERGWDTIMAAAAMAGVEDR